MSSDPSTVATAALMDAVSLLRGELAALARSNARLEESQQEIHRRLDVIDAGLAPLPDLLPYQEAILAKTLEGDYATHEWLKALAPVLDRIMEQSNGGRELISLLHQDIIRIQEIAGAGQKGAADVALGLEVVAGRLEEAASASRKDRKEGFTKTLELIGFTRAAVLGQREPLPVHVEDDPLMERFILAQAADHTSTDRALVDWRTAIAALSAAELITLLKKQQTPSPSDTPQSRVLRYRLAAITRAKIEECGAKPPARPTTTRATHRSAAASWERSQELAALWRAGESAELYAEPELAGAIDLFDALEGKLEPTSADAVQPELKALHRDLAKRIELGERPTLDESRPTAQHHRANTVEPSTDR
jgi:hypothetical protein